MVKPDGVQHYKSAFSLRDENRVIVYVQRCALRMKRCRLRGQEPSNKAGKNNQETEYHWGAEQRKKDKTAAMIGNVQQRFFYAPLLFPVFNHRIVAEKYAPL